MLSTHLYLQAWDSSPALKYMLLIVGILSILFVVFVSFAYIFTKQVREHPSILIVMTCICEGIFLYHELLNIYQQSIFYSPGSALPKFYDDMVFGL